MTEQEFIEEKKIIDSLSQLEMARLWRFAPTGHKYFDSRNQELVDYFAKRFKELGGFTPAISKTLGWGK